ncbi:MAG: site-specific DNA-methyltransferase [Labilithrix sp.]|nr:site-specific DNA-methyltransferase [Labilithrix sp.]MCW5814484.1 site-specific DNA-methyltransferase [Labilithrix sp.]
MGRSAENALVHADARDLGRFVAAGSADLAYLDPPFKVEKTFGARVARGTSRAKGPVAYDDTWPSLEAYLAWLEERVAIVRALLSPRGTMWLHLDQRAVHEAKVVCDRVFGARSFRGEVIWVPGNGSKSRTGPGMGHQTLLLYARGKEPIWNAKDPALRAPFAATSQAMHFNNVDADGRRYRDRTVGGKTYRYYADEGRALGSVWTDCPSMSANTPLRAETTGYPTQKPLKLLDRIVRASSAPRSLVVDPFCGSGTTLVAASSAGRRFAGADVGALAIATTRARLDAARISYAMRS